MDYPRKPGSDVRIGEEKWNQNAAFGHCPACGSIGMEEIPIPGDGEISFYCSDTTCRDLKGRRTLWADSKTEQLLAQENEGKSWNSINFPEQELPEFCPD